MGKKWDKFRLLMWKNWTLQYRRPIRTVFEILVPVVFAMLLVLIRSMADPEPHDTVIYPKFCTLPVKIPGICDGDVLNTSSSIVFANLSYTLIYSPTGPAIDKLMGPFKLFFPKVVGLDNSTELENYYGISSSNNTFAGIQFDDGYLDKETLPKDIKISLRFPGMLRTTASPMSGIRNTWHTNLVYPVFLMAGPRTSASETGAAPNYFKEGFLALQHILSLSLILHEKNISLPNSTDDMFGWLQAIAEIRSLDLPAVSMRRFPYSAWEEDILLTPLTMSLGMFFMLSFIYPCLNTVRAITLEKEKQLKETMKIMGLPNWLHWTAWYIKTIIFLFISMIIMVILLKVRWYTDKDVTVFTHANAFVILLFLFFYASAVVTFCFAISVFFSKANTAATIGSIAWFFSFFPYNLVQQSYDSLSLATKLMSCLGVNSGLGLGFQVILMYEGTEDGVQWYNLFSPNTPDDNLSLGLVMVMLIVDTFLYLVIALYFEAIFPGEFGVPQPWYFPFTTTYWCRKSRTIAVEDSSTSPNDDGEKKFEMEPTNLRTGVQIKNLQKLFGKKVAVKNLTLNMYEGQITALLGHNGAGKTTTMSMLTGMFPPTSGTALVNGYDIRSDIDNVRDSLGLCPQHNVIFDDLTVAEHLYFFSRLKGLRLRNEIQADIDKYVNLLELQDKRHSHANTLSGGMKRKLCVGIALCGNSKVVMLDEPTAGMDPSARRALWDLMLNQKEGRTVLLTTHFMDEADLLGDRIAIMAGGDLQCCGSSFFLKKKYGAGYNLIMEKDKDCNTLVVTDLLKKYIPNIEIHSNVGSELSYLLTEDQSHIFETMLKDLEMHSKQLGVASFGISLTTLEEVFMKVGADHSHDEDSHYEQNGNQTMSMNGVHSKRHTEVPFDVDTNAKVSSTFELIRNQFLAMTMKKVLSIYRTWILLVIQFATPVFFLILAMIVARRVVQTNNLPAMPLGLESFSDTITLMEKLNGSSDRNYSDIYNGLVESSRNVVHQTGDLINEMLNLTATVPTRVKRHYIIGATFECVNATSDITAWFNNDPFHSPGVTLGIVLNTVLKKVLGTEYNIEFINHPMPYDASTRVMQLSAGNTIGTQISMNMSFSMAIIACFYILFVIRERATNAKHLQIVSGAKVLIFWSCNWFWDILTYIITISVLMIALVSFQEDGYKSPSEIGRMIVILFSFGWSMLPMMYLAGYFFEVPSSGFTKMTLFNVFTGIVLYMVIQILASPVLDLEHVADALHLVFLTFPHYCLAAAVGDSYTLFAKNQICDEIFEMCSATLSAEQCRHLIDTYCSGVDDNYYKWQRPGIGKNIFIGFVLGTLLFLLLLLIEYRIFSRIIYKISQKFTKQPIYNIDNEDEDVRIEKTSIRNTDSMQLFDNYNLVMKNLTKYYKKHLAVNGLCLGVKKYECFGLLGVNGAGKTSTFKMLTGDTFISYGDAWVNGLSIKSKLKQVQKQIGYCPQFDALLDDLTARETIIIFALLRGIPYKNCNRIAHLLARDFDFSQHLDKQVKQLSGGNKRKLSTSLALIGNPPVIYLDEPTTGMDPATKRHLWNALCKIRDNGKCVILTSHSMEECEALCTRLAIMVNGNFKCLGSTQHLKNKFSEGYTITIKVKRRSQTIREGDSLDDIVSIDTSQIEGFMHDHFPNAILREKHDELLTFYNTDKSIPWSRMFGILETGKQSAEMNIEDYSLGQSSLEQVFLLFTRHQWEQ